VSKKLRYRLHWASGDAPRLSLKWAIYDWRLICPVAYVERRDTGRKVCALLNAESDSMTREKGSTV
jgi:hypothetical protein